MVVLWDLMGTLIHDPFFVEFIERLDEPVGSWMKNRDRQAWVDFELGHIEEHEFFERLFPEDPIKGLEMKSIFMNNYRFLPGVKKVLQRVNSEGGNSHVLSNYPEWYNEMFQRLELSSYFDRVFVSCDIGLRKPDPKIYQHVLQQLDCCASELIFIDDRRVNCQSASDLGIRTIQFSSAEHLEEALFKDGGSARM